MASVFSLGLRAITDRLLPSRRGPPPLLQEPFEVCSRRCLVRLRKLLEQFLLSFRQLLRDDNFDVHQQVAVATPGLWRASPLDPKDPAVLRARRNLDHHRSGEGGDLDLCAQRGLRERHRDRHMQISALPPPEDLVLAHSYPNVEIAGLAVSRSGATLPCDADARAVTDAGRYSNLRPLRERHGRSMDGLVEREHDLGLDIGPTTRPTEPKEILEDAPDAAFTEEVSDVADIDANASLSAGSEPVEASPSGLHERPHLVVLTALGVVGENGVRLGDLLEPLLRFLVALVRIGVILLGELAIGALYLVLRGVVRDAEDLVVVLVHPVTRCHRLPLGSTFIRLRWTSHHYHRGAQ